MIREICKNYIKEIKEEFNKEIEEVKESLDTKKAKEVLEKFQIKADTAFEIMKRYEEKEKQNS